MKALGCLGLLAVLSWLCLEAWAYMFTARLLNAHFAESIGSGGWWIPAVWIVAMAIVGGRIVKYHVAQVIPALLAGKAGRHVVGALGGVLIAIPGLISDIPGLLLLLPPVQTALGSLGNALVASVVKRSMGKMFGGASPFGGGASPFPGMRPRADDQATFPRRGKVIDTVAEKD